MFALQKKKPGVEGSKRGRWKHVLDSNLRPPIKQPMDFLYCHGEIEVDESQVRVAFKRKEGRRVWRGSVGGDGDVKHTQSEQEPSRDSSQSQ